jgi:penicillin-binding protein 2
MSLFRIYDDAEVNWRSNFIIFIIFFLFFILITRLVYLQVFQHEKYYNIAIQNTFKYIKTHPSRGLIYDRDNNLIASNKIRYDLYIQPQNIPFYKEYRGITSFKNQLNQLFKNRDNSSVLEKISNALPYEKILVKRNLSDNELAHIILNKQYLPEFDIEGSQSRYYPHHGIFSSFLGYVGNTTQKDLEKDYVIKDSSVGKNGLELIMDKKLYGNHGIEEIIIDSGQNQVDKNYIQSSINGENIKTTIDSELQNLAVSLLGDYKGSIVVVDVNTGDLLTMVSTPIFDPNLFTHGITQKRFDELQNSGAMFNRALYGQYPSASTIKPFIALSFLEGEFVQPDEVLWNGPFWQIPGKSQKYRDWVRTGHGDLTIKQAISRSADVFFYQTSYKSGFDYISDYLSLFGFGEKTNINLPYEKSGINPNSNWKKKNLNEPWYDGETLIHSIGQGYSLVTPLQLAYATAMLANEGTLFYPNYIYGQNPKIKRKVNFNQDDISLVKEGMYDVVYGEKGTARIIRDSKYSIAGKTGTAQVISTRGEIVDMDELSEDLQDHALFISFAPYENPEIAIAVIVENGQHGSSTAAPMAKKLTEFYLDKINKDSITNE